MEDTPNLKLPYLIAAQAQKHVTHNEALRKLDAIVQLAVLDRNLTTAPLSPLDGDRYIVAAAATGSWLGHEGEIAAFQDNSWIFLGPQEGWLCWIADEDSLVAWDGVAWNEVTGGGAVNPVPLVGINATADVTNRLSVSSPNSLFNHEGADHRVKVNKNAAGDTASFLFQSNFSGRAEIGLAGDDDFHFKVSADGSTWNEAIKIDGASGVASFPRTSIATNMVFNLFEDAGRFAGTPEPIGIGVGAFVTPSYLSPYNGSAFSAYAKFIHNNSTYGGTGAALDPEIDSFVSRFKTTNGAKQYGPEFWAMKVTSGTGTSGLYGGRYLAFGNRSASLWPKSSWGMHLRALVNTISVRARPDYELYLDGTKQIGDIVITPGDGWKQVIYVGIADPASSLEYSSPLHFVYADQSSQFLMALPFLTPAQIWPQTGDIVGRVPSLTAWR